MDCCIATVPHAYMQLHKHQLSHHTTVLLWLHLTMHPETIGTQDTIRWKKHCNVTQRCIQTTNGAARASIEDVAGSSFCNTLHHAASPAGGVLAPSVPVELSGGERGKHCQKVLFSVVHGAAGGQL